MHMTTVASRDLRNHTAEVLRQVSAGTRVTITVNGKPVAEIGPVRATRPQFFAKADLIELLSHYQSDSGLATDLEMLAGDTTDELDGL
jgi:prevent-host-death family protein